MRSDRLEEDTTLPIADRVGVAHDVLCQKLAVNPDEAFGVLGTAHIVDIGFPCAIEPCKVGPP